MTHKKRPITEKMYDYKKEKVEFARELGINGANNTEVNAKLAAQDEAKYSKENNDIWQYRKFNKIFSMQCFHADIMI